MDSWERMFRDEEEVLSFFLEEEFTEMINPITIICEDPIIHTATTGYYCSSLSNPDWATCPCRVAMEEQARAWQMEQVIISESLGAERAVELDPATGTLTILDEQHGVTLTALQTLVLTGFLKEHETEIGKAAYAALATVED